LTDLRDTIHPTPVSQGNLVYLEYHDNSPWAKAKVANGLVLTPESVAYMQREIDERKLRHKLYLDQLQKEQAAVNDSKAIPETSAIPADAAGERVLPAAGIRGPDGDPPQSG
jgi:hypothetical protein